MTPPGPATLAPTALIDSDHPAIVAFAAEHAQGATDRERAVALNLAVRDGIRYDPYRLDLRPEGMRQTMKTDLFIWHGFTEIWLDGAWRKATPAFNLSLCEKFGLLPLDFDGVHDSIYHPYDRAGNRHMEYVNQRGSFDDMPLDRIRADFDAFYGAWLGGGELGHADFQADAAKETAAGA